jgi:glycosyltransferase involved in cell wall biosynthesis
MLSIIVPTHNRPKSLVKLLESIAKQVHNNISFEVIVIANSKNDESLKLNLNQYDFDFKLFCSQKIGVNFARNLGIKNAKGDILFLTDDDCVLDDVSYLKKLIEAHEKYDKATAIGGLYDIPKVCAPIDKAYFIISRLWQKNSYLGSLETPNLLGGNVSYKKSSIEKLEELFYEKIVFGSSEFEFHLRLWKLKHSLVLLDYLKVTHITQLSLAQLKEKAKAQASTVLNNNLNQVKMLKVNTAYHDPVTLFAIRLSSSVNEFLEIMELVEVYNQNYKNQMMVQTMSGYNKTAMDGKSV